MRRFEQLEERIDKLLARVASLAMENKRLKETQSGQVLLTEENRKLKLALEEERVRSESALHRIDTLLQKLKMDDREA